MIDLHVHTNHSCDSEVTIEQYCEKAIKMGLKYICFTDHIDFNKADDGYGYYNVNKFFEDFNSAREKYSDRMNILCGIEFSEPHIYKKEFDEFHKLPYDFILGSIHFWLNDMFPSEMVKCSIPIEIVFEKYWEEVYKAVSYGGFDSMAHIDFPKRYYKKCLWENDQLNNIFTEMVKNDIALEINTSSLRKGLTKSMPDIEFLNIYQEIGGEKITIGADTHLIEELAQGYDYASNLIKGKLKNVVYINRKPNFISGSLDY